MVPCAAYQPRKAIVGTWQKKIPRHCKAWRNGMNYYIPVMGNPVDYGGSYRPEFGRSKMHIVPGRPLTRHHASCIIHHGCLRNRDRLDNKQVVTLQVSFHTSTRLPRRAACSLAVDRILVLIMVAIKPHTHLSTTTGHTRSPRSSEFGLDRKSTRLNSSHYALSRMPSSA